MKIGMDVEMALTHKTNGQFQQASRVMPADTRSRFGTDGCPAICEIRPKEHEEPRRLVMALKTAMKQGLKKYPNLKNYKWNGGSRCHGYSLGGHIHFGQGAGTRPQEITLKYLDSLLATFVVLMDDANAVRDRMRSGYGEFSAWRGQPWGWEYRTLPSFITEEWITRGVLELAKMLVEHCEQGCVSARELRDFERVKLTDDEKRALHEGNKALTFAKLEDRIAFIRSIFADMEDEFFIRRIKYIFSRTRLAKKNQYTLNHKDIREEFSVEVSATVSSRMVEEGVL